MSEIIVLEWLLDPHSTSRRILTLDSHQKRALTFMLMRELGSTVAGDPNDSLLSTKSDNLTKYIFEIAYKETR